MENIDLALFFLEIDFTKHFVREEVCLHDICLMWTLLHTGVFNTRHI